MAVEFRVLGDVEARIGGRAVEVGHARQRSVLVALLVEANRVVPADQLLDRVWGNRLPQRARTTVSGYLSRLRHVLAAARDVQIVRRPGGYVLTVDPMAVDLHRFHHLIAEARAADDADNAAALWGQALGLWRGEAFATLDTPWLNAVRDTLDVERLTAELDRNEVILGRGQHARLLGELSRCAAAHPLDERLAGQLMLALYRCGRQADALDAYQRVRLRLAEELGADPSPALQQRHQQILTADPALAAIVLGRSSMAPAGSPAPRQLPAPPGSFTGRARELAALDAVLAGGGEQPAALVICAVSGTAGVGKTALAVHWARKVGEAFPDGQLYVNLRGYDPQQPLSAGDALAGFLHALDVRGPDIPPQVDDRAARYRTELTGRRMLVVLDNAGSVEQVRPLLPGVPTCLVLVTSRDSLAGLVALDGARRLDLDLLPAADAIALLRRLIGARVDAEPQAAAALADRCARLPLALRIAAELAATRPTASVAELVGELTDRQRRLDLLAAGTDPRAAVRTVFSWSYRHLPTKAARVFRLLGLHRGPDFDPYAAAALTDTTLTEAHGQLQRLAGGHLIQPSAAGRYGMHDLLRAYATELAHSEDVEEDQRAALTRLFDHYLATATAATHILYPAEQHRHSRGPPPASPTQPLADAAAARVWLDTERANLVTACAHTAGHGWGGRTVALAAVLFPYLDAAGHYTDALTVHARAGRAAHHGGDPTDGARALTDLGLVYWRQGHYGPAAEQFEQALVLSRQSEEQAVEARALDHLAMVYWRQGHYGRAAEHLEQALTLSRQAGDPVGQARAQLALGRVYERQGHFGPAAECLEHALDRCRQIGERALEADVMNGLGLVHEGQGHHGRATEHLEYALDLCRRIGYQASEADALNGLGETLQATGRVHDARTRHVEALALAVDIDDRYEQARAHRGIAATHHATGDPYQAGQHWQQALTLYTDLGVPDAETVRAHLTALGTAIDWRRAG